MTTRRRLSLFAALSVLGACPVCANHARAQFPTGGQQSRGQQPPEGIPSPAASSPPSGFPQSVQRKPGPPEHDRGSSSLSIVGCGLTAAGLSAFAHGGVPLLRTCGDPRLDATFSQEALLLARSSGLQPGFSFFQESSSGNAFATPERLLGSGDGTVIFGVTLIREQIATRLWWGAALAGIMAHEWGHIAQFQDGSFSPGKSSELHADYLAGWYMGFKEVSGIARVEISGLGKSLFSKGDYNFNSRDHHGTPDQRVAAMTRGYRLAHQGVRSFQTAFDSYTR